MDKDLLVFVAGAENASAPGPFAGTLPCPKAKGGHGVSSDNILSLKSLLALSQGGGSVEIKISVNL